MADESQEQLMLRVGQQQQIIDQYRVNLFNLDLKFQLLNKMFEEKGLFGKGEFDTRWPLYLKTDVGVLGNDGIMEGSLKVTFFNNEEPKKS